MLNMSSMECRPAKTLAGTKIALVCDWLTGMRGGEKCLKAICEVFPGADIFTLVYYPQHFSGAFDGHAVRTSFIQRLPWNERTFRHYLPLFPKAIESFNFTPYDVVISFSHCVAKGVQTSSRIPHICYCHTPARYVWDMQSHYTANMGFIKKRIVSQMLARLKPWDIASAGRVNYYIANSNHIQQRIKRCYNQDSQVIYPPVDVNRFQMSTTSDGYYLVLSAWVPYKRVDVAIQAFSGSKRKLVIAGRGPESERLKRCRQPNVEFVDNPDDAMVEQLLGNCRALIFPGQEDFGIVPLEAQACGKPVIAYGAGGALETVVGIDSADSHCATGILYEDPSPQSLLNAVERFEQIEDRFSPEHCRRNAQRFNTERYQSQMLQFIESVWDAWQ